MGLEEYLGSARAGWSGQPLPVLIQGQAPNGPGLIIADGSYATPELIAAYAGHTIIGVKLSFLNANVYQYELWFDSTGAGTSIAYAIGTVSAGPVVNEFYQLLNGGTIPQIIYGGTTVPGTVGLAVQFGASTRANTGAERFTIMSSANFDISSGSAFTIDSRTAPRGFLAGADITTGAMTAAVSVETDVPSAALQANVVTNGVYLIHLVCRANLSDMSQAYEIRMRRDNNVGGGGTQVGVLQLTNNGTAAAGVFPIVLSLLWISAATETLKLFFSIVRTSAAGTIQLLGSPGGGQRRAWKGFEHVGSTDTWTTA